MGVNENHFLQSDREMSCVNELKSETNYETYGLDFSAGFVCVNIDVLFKLFRFRETERCIFLNVYYAPEFAFLSSGLRQDY